MIHTAEEILEGEIKKSFTDSFDSSEVLTDMKIVAVKAIKEAQTEAIKECAETMYDYYDPSYGFDKEEFLKNTLDKIK